MEKIEFTELNISKLNEYFDNALCGDFPHVFDFTPEKIISKSHPATKDFLKFLEIPISEVLKYKTKAPDLIKFPINKLKKIIGILSMYDKMKINSIDGTIFYDKDGNHGLVAKAIQFKQKKLNFKIPAGEMAFAPEHISDSSWANLSDVGNPLLKMVFDKEMVDKVCSLTSFQGKSEFLIVYDKETNKIIIRSHNDDTWAFEYESDFDASNIQKAKAAFLCRTLIFDHMDAPIFDFYIKQVTPKITGSIAKKNDSHQLFVAVIEADTKLL